MPSSSDRPCCRRSREDCCSLYSALKRGLSAEVIFFMRAPLRFRAAAKTGEHIAPVGSVEIAPGVAQQRRARRMTAAAQHLVVAEPRLRVFLIRVANEVRIRVEPVRGPFPNVAEQLAAAPRAVPRLERSHICRGVAGAEKIGARGIGSLVTPWVSALALRIARRGRRGLFPLGLARQPASGPAAPRICLVPVDVDDRRVKRQRLQPVVDAVLPRASLPDPINGCSGERRIAPLPACIAPPVAPLVSTGVDECGKFAVGDRGARNRKRGEGDAGGPPFLVENETPARWGA